MNLVISAKKKLFCAFIDFKQAFDTVRRNSLCYKLLNNGISGKCLIFIRNMYNGVKSMVSINGQSSYFFNCNVGVRQGEILSPLLLSLFINDLEEFLASKSAGGITIGVKDSTTVEMNFLCM